VTILGITFAEPILFWLAWIAPLVVAALVIYDRAVRNHLTRQLGELPVLGRVIATASPGRRMLKDVMTGTALWLILLAASRPQTEGKRNVEMHGLDVVVAVDVSKSMLVDDVGATQDMTAKRIETTRLARARELAGALIDVLPGDRVGPVVFAGAAAHFPLTEDYEVAKRFLGDLGPQDLPVGSNLGEVLRVSRCMLRPDLYEDLGCAKIGRRGHGGDPLSSTDSLDPPGKRDDDDVVVQKIERGKAIVIFTDGGEPDEEALKGVATARELGIAVFFVGVGSAQGGLVWDVDFAGRRTAPKHKRDGSTITSKRDDDAMRKLAEVGGDDKRYLIAAERGEVDPTPIVEALRAVNRGVSTKKVKEMKEHYQVVLFAGLMLLIIEAAIATRRRRPHPEAR